MLNKIGKKLTVKCRVLSLEAVFVGATANNEANEEVGLSGKQTGIGMGMGMGIGMGMGMGIGMGIGMGMGIGIEMEI